MESVRFARLPYSFASSVLYLVSNPSGDTSPSEPKLTSRST